ncbi:exopolysaccharide biosynthesis polyprenyl glycosylphosphotransferase [Peribacillus frigoritolerans]|uniref:exopolysaccharide biosynthesis polyprenyl glycosylphosphotransferase n=1 Tax=Peribacillus frigoritolerans TaxID=450367 RepID=UPI003D28B35E
MEIKEEKQYFSDVVIRSDFSSSKHRIYFTLKKISDFVLALIGLLITLPILLLFCLAIKIESKGAAFYLQERVGLNGELFYIIKLRSMHINAEKNGAQWALKNDPRVTRVGSFIRKTRIDEIPQLINVLKGEMSLIGPRPERPMFNEQFNREISGFNHRLIVKPGITGWAQVNGGYDISPEEKLRFDIYYIRNLSIVTDIKIILKTVKVVITGDGAR